MESGNTWGSIVQERSIEITRVFFVVFLECPPWCAASTPIWQIPCKKRGPKGKITKVVSTWDHGWRIQVLIQISGVIFVVLSFLFWDPRCLKKTREKKKNIPVQKWRFPKSRPNQEGPLGNKKKRQTHRHLNFTQGSCAEQLRLIKSNLFASSIFCGQVSKKNLPKNMF